MSIRMQNIMADFGNTDYDSEDPFATRRRPKYESPIQTQDSVFADQSKGQKEHPAVTDSWNRIKSIFDSYSPDTSSTDRLNNFLDNAPQINKPSFMRKLAATGAAIGNVGPHFTRTGGGADAADRVLYAPYLQQMADFKEKAGPLQSAASAENSRNINERTLIGNMATASTAADKNDANLKIAEEKADIARQRNAVLASKDMGFTYTILGDDLIGHKPDGTTFHAGRASNFNATELEILKQKGRMAVEGARNEGDLAVQDSRNAGNLAVAQTRGQDSEDVATIRTGGQGKIGAAKPLTPAATARDRVNKAIEIAARNPRLSPYIKVNGMNITMDAPKDGLIFKNDPQLKKDFDEARDIIFPKQGNPILTGVNTGFGSNIPDAPIDAGQRQRAQDFVKSINKPLTEANIQHAIKTGRVK